MNITVIIVTFNSAGHIINCLDSLFNQEAKSAFDILIVDNASSDNTVKIIGEKYPDIRLIENDKNYGFGRAVNTALKNCKTEFAFLLNPDTVIINDAVGHLHNYMLENEDAGSCGGALYDNNMNPVVSYGFFPSLLQVFFEETGLRKIFGKFFNKKLSPGCMIAEEISNPFDVDYVSGADMFIRMKALEKCGYLDEEFFMYYEETELSYRLKKTGFRNVIVPESRIIHHEGKSLPDANFSKYVYMKRSEFLFFKKCYGNIRMVTAKILYLQGCLLRLFLFFDKSQISKFKITLKA